MLEPPQNKSFFLFGPRGTGKSCWAREHFEGAVYVDLLESRPYTELLADPGRLDGMIPASHRGWVVLDEVQKVPALLDEVHRLIERRRLRFVLTGSSARKLRRSGVNLLAGRALTLAMHPLTCFELGSDYAIQRSLRHGQLPAAYVEDNPQAFLDAYVKTYLREEVQQEGLVRNLAAFSRFLEAASFSQGALLNVSAVARECSVERKVVEDYFGILDDLMLATRLRPFARRAKRQVVAHAKFYFFDVGVWRTLRPRGPLDSGSETDGPALETLLLQELRAHNDVRSLGYQIFFWRTVAGEEVDFVLYGERGLHAFEVKRTSTARRQDLDGLRAFKEQFPVASCHLVYGGTRRSIHDGVDVVPFERVVSHLHSML